MAILPIRTFPDPRLTAPTRPVDRVTPAIRRRIDDMIATMRHHPRCVGLAAPQIGWHVRVAVMDVTGHPQAAFSHGLVVLVNPLVLSRDGARVQREGCLSVPDFTGNVQRAQCVHVTALDRSGQPWSSWLEGFEAVAAQHEIDHLDGKLFLDRVANLKTDVFRRKTYLFPKTTSSP